MSFQKKRTPRYLVSQGTTAVERGTRRLVDPRWFRGASYLTMGWRWVHDALSRGYELISSVSLSSERDPEPAIAFKKQAQQRQRRLVFESREAA